MTYDSLAYFAKTWGLVYLFVMFLVALFYALRPSARQRFEEAAQIPLKED